MFELASAAVIIGTDCPGLDARTLEEAFDSLHSHDVVLGPARDGGYYLIGLRASAPVLFQNMAWGTEVVLEETLRRAEAMGLTVHRLGVLDDVDVPADLTVWRHYQALGRRAPAGESPPLLSVVIPTLNEAERITATIQSARCEGVEIIVSDGGSVDGTREIAARACARVICSSLGRGPQMNAGAGAARGKNLLFLHADTILPDGYRDEVLNALQLAGVVMGAFSLRIDSPGLLIRGVEQAVRARCALFSLPYGDQAFFLRSALFHDLGGFAAIPLLEDLDLVRRARRKGRVLCLRSPVVSSGRRWAAAGTLRMTLINQLCALGFHLGVAPARLTAWRDRLSSARKQRVPSHSHPSDHQSALRQAETMRQANESRNPQT